jgi:hypothetical protein
VSRAYLLTPQVGYILSLSPSNGASEVVVNSSDLDLGLNLFFTPINCALCLAILRNGTALIPTHADGGGDGGGDAAVTFTGSRAGRPRWVFSTARHP